ncbi:DNA mismatch endonuclease Vsr [Cellulomonas sp. JZ18]|nr:DNA mismatch endonuclease Vsr [Cellulomonas sp. JZ18]
MRANRRRDTAPEVAVRKAVHAAGLRFRVDARPLPDVNRRADMVFRPAKVAVFVDGCFWHGCVLHGTAPRTNAPYWSSKITRNKERDADTDRRLAERGWVSLRFWEHEDPIAAARAVVLLVSERRRSA